MIRKHQVKPPIPERFIVYLFHLRRTVAGIDMHRRNPGIVGLDQLSFNLMMKISNQILELTHMRQGN